eukprot:COSAG06_NODE_180_length_20940_cov_7.005758_11_plen_90_part_00
MAVVHFASTTAEAGGYTDRNAVHEAEEALETRLYLGTKLLTTRAQFHRCEIDGLLLDTEPPKVREFLKLQWSYCEYRSHLRRWVYLRGH